MASECSLLPVQIRGVGLVKPLFSSFFSHLPMFSFKKHQINYLSLSLPRRTSWLGCAAKSTFAARRALATTQGKKKFKPVTSVVKKMIQSCSKVYICWTAHYIIGRASNHEMPVTTAMDMRLPVHCRLRKCELQIKRIKIRSMCKVGTL